MMRVISWLVARLICLRAGHEEFRCCDPVRRTFGYACARCGRESVVTCDYNEPRVTAPVAPKRMHWLRGVHIGKGA